MTDWKKLSAPVLIFALVPFLLLGACQTAPEPSSPDVVSEVAQQKDETACEHFEPPIFTDAEIEALSPDAANIAALWAELWADYECYS
ncbi:MAG: hypothetical protein AAFP81_19610 [Pseudomonadota bacterium]